MYPFKNLKFKNIYFIIINDQKYFNWKSIFLQTIRNYLGLEKSCYFTQKVTACNIRCGHENKTMSQQEYFINNLSFSYYESALQIGVLET